MIYQKGTALPQQQSYNHIAWLSVGAGWHGPAAIYGKFAESVIAGYNRSYTPKYILKG